MILALVSFLLVLVDRNDQFNSAALIAMFSTFWFVFLALFIFQIYCYWRVAQKCGYPGVYSLLVLIPLVNIVITLMWVFSEWPIETELKRFRAASATTHTPVIT